ncbi:MAG: MlaD family protein [Candidatus Cloacimonadaceae bacterium]|nr:MlaD family protein [Candidatus Cloacimonadaceae bacterium]MDP3114889.1 MlaD family protein [Candidatus Cloacimonadaceae bacterium]
MTSKTVKIRLGIFITLGLALLATFFAVVAGNRLIQKRDIYYIQFENYSVSGLQVGGTVNYQGIKVGRVEQIKIDPKDITKIIITISVDRGTPIKSDTEAVLVAVGITGIKAVEIRGGSNEAKLMNPKTFIKSGTSMFDDITDKAMSIAEKVDEIAANISSLTDEENRKNIAAILNQTSLLLYDTRTNLSSTLASLNEIARNTAEVTAGLGNNLDKLTDNLTKNLDNLTNSTTGSIDALSTATIANLNTVTVSTTRNLDSLSAVTQKSIEAMTAKLGKELDLISLNLNKSISDINTQTSLLLTDTRFHLNNIGSHSDELILSTTKQITEITMNINRSLDRVHLLFASGEFESLLRNVNVLSVQLADANVKGLVTELATTVNRVGSLIANMDRTLVRSRSNLLETIESLRDASENLNEFSRQISDQPSVLIRGN